MYRKAGAGGVDTHSAEIGAVATLGVASSDTESTASAGPWADDSGGETG